jgi:hypothetical protein
LKKSKGRREPNFLSSNATSGGARPASRRCSSSRPDHEAAALDGDAIIKKSLGAIGQTVNVHGPAEFAANIKDMKVQLKSIADTLGLKAATQ